MIYTLLLFIICIAIYNLAGASPPDMAGFDLEKFTIPLMFGLLVDRAALNSLFVNLRTNFNKVFEAAVNEWQEVAMEIPSSTKAEDYGWLSSFPKMRKWVGEKFVKALKAYKYSVTNEDWEATVEVDRNDIEDDTIGIYKVQAEAAGESAKQLTDEIVSELTDKGFVNTCFDGQYFYDTDHPVAGASVSNKLTAALSNATLAAADASLGQAIQMMEQFKDDEGRPLNVKPTILEVPSALKNTAKALCENEKLQDNTPNPYRGVLKLKVNLRLTSNTAWFVHCTTRPIKPFVIQMRKKPVFVQQTDPESDNVFMNKKFRFGAEARAAGGYTFWQLSAGSDGTV